MRFLADALTAALGTLLLFVPYVPFSPEVRIRFTPPPAVQPAPHTPPAAPGREVPSESRNARSGSGSTEGLPYAP